MVSYRVKSGLFIGFGALLFIFGVIAVVMWPSLFISQLQRMMTLTNDSMTFEIWRETPIPMYLECHMFNLTNVKEILAREDVKVKVEQLGPYVFREFHSKENLTWNDENSTVTYFNKRSWHFDEERSNGSLSDLITSINPIVVTIAYMSRNDPLYIRLGTDVFIRLFHSDMFLTANVSSWLFDGIEDAALDAALDLPFVADRIPYDKFGWFYERNNSLIFDGAFNMNTGAADFSNLGNMENWQYSNRTVYRDECGDVKGSSGELWAPEYGQEEVVIFASDICTYLVLSKNESVLIEGIEGVLYAANDSVFDNGHKYPHTACYCDEPRDNNCLPPGALNVSECRFGAPAFVTLPHFYNADPYYPSKIEGLNPTPDMNFRLALEMFTGMPLQVFAQLQINLLVRHISGISINNQLPDSDTLVPMFWFRQEVSITPEYAALARQALRLRYWTVWGLAGFTVIGTILLIVGISILIRRILRTTESPIIDSSDNSDSQ
ncbi:protein croquemort-like [Plodia interpunctella]|uniref:protein croquemort-like n=1 Tax=Plodia interpunctella TaxID=58824 RepID=UPI0023684CD5|nr:protein croquemort-like [Plodia interpunctella]